MNTGNAEVQVQVWREMLQQPRREPMGIGTVSGALQPIVSTQRVAESSRESALLLGAHVR